MTKNGSWIRIMTKEQEGYNNKRKDYMIRKEDLIYFR